MANNLHTDVLIIGAGLTGLSTAYFLRNSGLDILIAESRDRIGGRIHTLGIETNEPIEMGATWLGAQHKNLLDLLDELGLSTFEQEMGTKAIFEPISTSPPYLASFPKNADPTLRIKGGTMQLINKLSNHIDQEKILLSTKLEKVSWQDDQIIASTNSQNITAKCIVSTLPPRLALNSVSYEPALPVALVQIGNSTHTWMGESIKVALTFAEPFWRTEKSSGTIISNVGPIPEMYDHSNYEDSFYALKGFLNGNYFSVTKEERLALIMKQLKKYYGTQVENYLSYDETVWRNERDTFFPYTEHILPHQNNGHSAYQSDYMDGRLIFGGSETSSQHPGYMEGAVHSARHISAKLKATLS